MLVLSRFRSESIVLFTSDGPVEVMIADVWGNKGARRHRHCRGHSPNGRGRGCL